MIRGFRDLSLGDFPLQNGITQSHRSVVEVLHPSASLCPQDCAWRMLLSWKGEHTSERTGQAESCTQTAEGKAEASEL